MIDFGLTSKAKDVDRKFSRAGDSLPYRGNTIVSMIPSDSMAGAVMGSCQRELRGCKASSAFAMLPASSLHMTVFELLCDAVRDPEYWSAYLPLDSDIRSADQFFRGALAGLQFPPPVDMDVVALSTRTGITLELVPADRQAEWILRSFRERVSDRTGVRFPNHDHYGFHVTLAYRLRPLSHHEAVPLAEALEVAGTEMQLRAPQLRIPSPSFRVFDDMTAFASTRASDQSASQDQLPVRKGSSHNGSR